MISLFVLTSQESFNSQPDMIISMIANYNGDCLYAVNGDANLFKQLNPTARGYYEADWEQNAFPNAPGDNPLEKYLNGINNMYVPNSPNWTAILPAIASNKQLFTKLMSTRNYNAFSTLQTVINFRDMDLFMYLTKAVIEGITDPLTEQEISDLNGILIANNFPSLAELTSA